MSTKQLHLLTLWLVICALSVTDVAASSANDSNLTTTELLADILAKGGITQPHELKTKAEIRMKGRKVSMKKVIDAFREFKTANTNRVNPRNDSEKARRLWESKQAATIKMMEKRKKGDWFTSRYFQKRDSRNVYGLSEARISRMPSEWLWKSWPDDCCCICLDEFKKGDMVTDLVGCKHRFHRACINESLARDRRCPLCRKSAEFGFCDPASDLSHRN